MPTESQYMYFYGRSTTTLIHRSKEPPCRLISGDFNFKWPSNMPMELSFGVGGVPTGE